MANEGIVSDSIPKLQNGLHSGAVAIETSGIHVAAGSIEAFAKSAGGLLPAFGVGTAVSAGVTQWDYVQERDNIRKQYDMELSAQTGKAYNEVTNKDLDNLGKKNIVVADALKRAKWKRNVGLAVGGVAMIAALGAAAAALTLVVAPALAAVAGGTAVAAGLSGIGSAVMAGNFASAGLGLAQIVGVGLASVPAFIGTEKLANAVVDAKFGKREPSIHKVTKNPALQEKLSISSQVKYLEHLQKRVNSNKPETFISQEQVFTTILAAQPQMAEQIKGKYGNKFSSLAPEQRKQVLAEVNKDINLEQITADLNHRQIRAQELAFIVQGESSGVPRRETPRLSAMERAHTHMANELAEAKNVIAGLKQHIKVTDTKLGNVMNAQLDMSKMDQPPAPPPEPPVLTQEDVGPATKRLLAERKASGQQNAVRA